MGLVAAAEVNATNIQTVRRIYRHFDPDYLKDVSLNLDAGLGLSTLVEKPPFQKTS